MSRTLLFESEGDDVYKLRSWSGVSRGTRRLISLITLSDDTRPVGSFKYKAHKYPSDIDIFERFVACCDDKTALAEIVSRLKELVKDIEKDKYIFWGDFKAGLDVRFYGGPEKLMTSKSCREHLKNISYNLSDDEYDNLYKLLDDPELFNDELRKLYVIRWSPLEILGGKKELRGGLVITLGQAISQNSVVKLDLWAPIDGRYNELTNFLIFERVDVDGNKVVLNQELGDRRGSLMHDIVKYSSEEHYNPLKYAKRLWNWSIFVKNKKLSEKLAPLFSSGVALMSQMMGELEVVQNLVKRYKLENVPKNILRNQFEHYRVSINDINDIGFNDDEFYELLDVVDECMEIGDENKMIGIISDIISKLREVIDYYSDLFIKENGLKEYNKIL